LPQADSDLQVRSVPLRSGHPRYRLTLSMGAIAFLIELRKSNDYALFKREQGKYRREQQSEINRSFVSPKIVAEY